MAPSPKLLFTPEEVVAACRKAKADGDSCFDTVFSITPGGRSSPGAHYFDLICRAGGKEGKLFLNFRQETFVGRIWPLNPGAGSQARDPSRSPTLGIQRYPDLKEGDSVDQADQSSYFLAIECLDTFLQSAAAALLDAGMLYSKTPSDGPKPGSVKIKNSAVIRLFQEAVSLNSRVNPGMPLANPIARMGLKFADDGEPRKGVEFFEILKDSDPRKKECPIVPLEFDGRPLCAANVHLLQPGSAISGVVDISAVCCSNMGISVPSSVRCLYIKLAADSEPEWDSSAVLGGLL